METLRACGHMAPAVCQDADCPDWRQAYVLDICCSCQRSARQDRAASWKAELELASQRAELRRQLGFLRQARAAMLAIGRELKRKRGAV